NLENANLENANLENANLEGANLKTANLKSARHLTFQKLKAAENWDQACYNPEFRKRLRLPLENPNQC
ncbi:pentapeptide repeat-containing protein, partial [Nostoc sp. JL33]|uniref:pentapeptide repeat-containing protein n=1 Tax=Nostoc sp. JL33 TaxID=2815396 RepID=UPI0025E10DF6